MSPQKIKLVVSDFHLGRGKILPDGSFNYLEDFVYDDKFIEFLRYYSSGPFAEREVELISNGDFFNHLQVDMLDPNPDVIDEKIAIYRMRQILEGHPKLFEAMRQFVQTPGHSITFLLGNHDPGLLFSAVHEELKLVLGERIQVILGTYLFDGVHVEHGNQYFADNAYNRSRYFLTKDLPSPVVNLPWGSYFVIHLLNNLKRERPYVDKVYPFKHYLLWALFHDTLFAVKAVGKIVFYFFWLRFRRDPHRRSSLWTTLKIIIEVPISPKLDREAKKILLSERDIHLVIFGHTHYAIMRQFAPGKTYINTGLWNEQVSLEISNPGKIVRLTYALLEYDDKNQIHPSLKEWKGSYKVVEDV